MATVLVADDDPDIRFLITFKLRQSGHDIREFADGLSALADARRAAPDLAVLDVMMPGMSGLDVCRELRGDPVTAGIPIIILTARAQDSDIEAGLAAGASDYIVKPFSPRELMRRIGIALAGIQA